MEWLKKSKKKEKKKNERGMEVAVVGNRLISLYSWVPIKLLLDKSDVMRLRDNYLGFGSDWTKLSDLHNNKSLN